MMYMQPRWPAMWNLNEPERQPQEHSDENMELSTLEQLPVELLEEVFSYLRPSDLAAVAETSEHLQMVVRNARFWKESTLQLSCKHTTRPLLQQLKLAPEAEELIIAATEDHEVTDVVNYDGPTPVLRSLNLRLSQINSEYSIALLEKFGQKSRHVILDLLGRPETPHRNNLPLLRLLPKFPSIKSVSIRIGCSKDLFKLCTVEVRLVNLDIHNLKYVSGVGNFSEFLCAAAVTLIYYHQFSLEYLILPAFYDDNLGRAIRCCKKLCILGCSVWSLKDLQYLPNLHTLHIFQESSRITAEDIEFIFSDSEPSKYVLQNMEEIHFLRNAAHNTVSDPPLPEYGQALMCVILARCRTLQVLEIDWDIGDIVDGEDAWLSLTLGNNAASLREIRLHGNELLMHHYLTLSLKCFNLEILDMRGCSKAEYKPFHFIKSARVSTLLRKALPNLTVMYNEDGREKPDWNFYSSPDGTGEFTNCAHEDCNNLLNGAMSLSEKALLKLFAHTQSLEQLAVELFLNQGFPSWQCATLDSSLWTNKNFTEVLELVPALGLLDCCNRSELSPMKGGSSWFTKLINGPKLIGALRIQAVLVPHHHWENMPSILLGYRTSLRRLELDFRDQSHHEWRKIFSVLHKLSNLEDFVLCGFFESQEPLFDYFRGKMPPLKRLDLSNCEVMEHEQLPAIVESLRMVLLELRDTLSAFAMPPLPSHVGAPLFRTMGELPGLTEVALDISDVEYLGPLKSLSSLKFYAYHGAKTITVKENVASNLRNIADSLKGVEILSLPRDLMKSQTVQEAVIDVMPRLRKLELTHTVYQKVCVDGPQWRDVLKNV